MGERADGRTERGRDSANVRPSLVEWPPRACQSASYSNPSVTGTPSTSHASPVKAAEAGVSSINRRRRKPLYGAIPVPVATMMMSAEGVASGMSITLPVGPVKVTSLPGLESQRKLEHTPFFAGSSAPRSLSQYTARRTHSDTVLPSSWSP